MSYFIKFSVEGFQEEFINSETSPGADWKEVDEIDGVFYQLKNNIPVVMTEQELSDYRDSLTLSSTLVYVRNERNERLIRSDWTQLSSSTLSNEKKIEWETYRQALRDMPDTVTGPEVVWPEEPTL
jgi:hypothetical protein